MPRSDSTCYLRFALPSGAPRESSDEPVRAPLLERLLARADERPAAADWRREGFALIAAPGEAWPGIGATVLHRAFGPVDARSVYLATPVAYAPTLTSLHLAADGLVALDGEEAAALAAGFDRTFAPAQRLLVAPQGELVCVFDRPLAAETCDPADALGADVGPFQASGPDAAALRLAASEIEMWLHEQPLNQARERRGALPVDGLWLWGGGPPLARAPRIDGWTAGRDPFFEALAPAARDAPAAFGRGAGVVCIAAAPGSAEWLREERRSFAPALAALAAGRIGRIVVRAGERAFEYGAAQRRRFWRGARPWLERLA